MGYTRIERNDQAFLKKLAMLPWPFFPAGFPFALLDGLGGAGLALGWGSSSEKDSHTASSFVTRKNQSGCAEML